MPLERRAIERALSTKGFVLKSGDHDFYLLTVAGLTTSISTKLSRGTGHREYGEPLVAKMAKQLKMTTRQLKDFVDCRLGGEDYLQHLRDRGILRGGES